MVSHESKNITYIKYEPFAMVNRRQWHELELKFPP